MNKRTLMFFSSLVITLLLAYIVDFHRQLMHIFHERQQIKYYDDCIREDKHLINEKTQVEHDLFLVSSKESSLHIIDNPASLLFRIFFLAQSSNCAIKLIHPGEPKHVSGKNFESIDLVLIGQLPQLTAFFYEVEHGRLPLVINHIILHRETRDEWRMEMGAKAFLAKLIANGFLLNKADPSIDNIEFPISQMRYAGQIQSGRQQWAFVKLPNTKTLPVKIGSILGAEKLIVMGINTKKQKIILINKQEVTR